MIRRIAKLMAKRPCLPGLQLTVKGLRFIPRHNADLEKLIGIDYKRVTWIEVGPQQVVTNTHRNRIGFALIDFSKPFEFSD